MILRAKITEIPAHLNWGTNGSKNSKRRSSMRIMRSILSSLISGFMFRPFMFFVLPGIALSILSAFSIFWAFIHTLFAYQNLPRSGTAFDDFTSTALETAFSQYPHTFFVAGFSLMVSMQMISLGFIALQNKRYFEELFHLGSSNIDL